MLNDSVCGQFLRSWTETLWLLWQYDIQTVMINVSGDCFVDKVRNHLVTKFINEFPHVDNFFFLDDDIGWPAQKVLEFLLRPQEIVCGVYPKKTDNSEWPIDLAMDRESGMMIGDPETGLMTAQDTAPAGFMRFKRAALMKLIAKSPVYTEPAHDGSTQRRYAAFDCGYDWHARDLMSAIQGALDGKDGWEDTAKAAIALAKNGGWRGEDADMVRKARELGMSVYVDPDIEFSHTGRKTWRGNFVTRFQEWREAWVAEQQKVKAA